MRACAVGLVVCCLAGLGEAALFPPVHAPQSPRSADLVELLDAYADKRFARVDDILSRIADPPGFSVDLPRAARDWIAAAGPQARTRRRQVAAAVALEAAARYRRAHIPARELVAWGAAQLARDPRGEVERAWYLAAIAWSEAAYDAVSVAGSTTRGGESWDVPKHALERFPDDDRFHLARALTRELASWRDVLRAEQLAELRGERDAAGRILRDLARDFESLLPRQSIRADVRLRLGYTYLRLDRPAAALEQFAQVEPLTRDPFLVYLSRFFTGRARQAAGDRAGAIAAFRGALDIVPRAQSASFALAALAFTGDDRDAAYAAVRSAVPSPTLVDDPWRLYATGSARFWPALITSLRQAIG